MATNELARRDQTDAGELVRRHRRVTNQMAIAITVQRSRTFFVNVPDGLPFDNDDADRITAEIEALSPAPDEIQGPVASGLGDLVAEEWAVTYVEDKRSDLDIMLDLEDAVRAGFINRAWLVNGHTVLSSWAANAKRVR